MTLRFDTVKAAMIAAIILLLLQWNLTPTYAFFTSTLGVFITIIGFVAANRLKKIFSQIIFVVQFLIFLNYLASFVL